jgi:hypothetical protein
MLLMQTEEKYFMADFSSADSRGKSLTRQENFFFTDFHQNHIRPDLTDLIPGNYIFQFRSEQIAKTKRTGNNNGTDTSFAFIKNQITDTAKPFAVASIDHIFFF